MSIKRSTYKAYCKPHRICVCLLLLSTMMNEARAGIDAAGVLGNVDIPGREREGRPCLEVLVQGAFLVMRVFQLLKAIA